MKRTLWRRFEVVMELHILSVRNIDVKKLQQQPDTRPHYVYIECPCIYGYTV